ncbi:MAG: 4-(cytidine 5'-diphospho)-2-C-methyl-D-erythritol kinase [Hyphomicrobiales bacterium]|nr:4-(cytidine 5'-diphospho)-2-C-methyl-D-erythritol kinase [Hyphomicrobiales bacterium]
MSLIAPVIDLDRAPAKINLALHVVGQREDGYHLLESLVVFTRFADRVTVGRAEADQFAVTGPYASAIPTDEGNLVLKARDALRAALPQGADFPVSISLEKNLPPASGIGGGSSDAATTLKGLTRLWEIDEALLPEIGLSLGADVPMCLSPHPALVSGIGEKVERLPGFPPLFVVLVNPGVEMPTPAVFSRLGKKNNPGLERPVPGGCEALYAWLGETRNDLEAPALELAPVIGETLEALRSTQPFFVRMSGSGATCFALYGTSREAEAAAAHIRRVRPDWFVMATGSFAGSGEEHGGN